MGFLPVFVDLTGRRCLVVGGGRVAERKVATLLELGADVKVVGPRPSARLRRWVEDGSIRHHARGYQEGDLEGQQMVFVASDDSALNRAVAAAGRRRGIWVNAADDPANCDFILPSILRRGPVTVAVSTGGASPALARLIREELEDHVSSDYGTMAECAAEVRRELRRKANPPTASAWHGALDREFRLLAAGGDRDAAKAYLLARLTHGSGE